MQLFRQFQKFLKVKEAVEQMEKSENLTLKTKTTCPGIPESHVQEV